MERKKMSLTDWAQRRPLKNKNQRDLLIWMAGNADDKGRTPASRTAMIANVPEINTPAQADRALRGLVDGGLVTASWDPDTYTHYYTLNAR